MSKENRPNVNEKLIATGLAVAMSVSPVATSASEVGTDKNIIASNTTTEATVKQDSVDIIQKTIDVPAQIVSIDGVGKTMLPIRALIESLGGTIEMSKDGKIFTIVKDSKTYTINRDPKTNKFTYNGQELSATIKDNRTLMGVRDIGEKVLKLDRVEWDGDNKRVYCLDLNSKTCVGMKIGSNVIDIYQEGNYQYHQTLIAISSRISSEKKAIFKALNDHTGAETFAVNTFRDERTGTTVRVPESIAKKYSTPLLLQVWFDANFNGKIFNSNQVVEIEAEAKNNGITDIYRITVVDIKNNTLTVDGKLVDKVKELESRKGIYNILMNTVVGIRGLGIADKTTTYGSRFENFYNLKKTAVENYLKTGECDGFVVVKDNNGMDKIVVIDNEFGFVENREEIFNTLYFLYKNSPDIFNKHVGSGRILSSDVCYVGWFEELNFAATWNSDYRMVIYGDASNARKERWLTMVSLVGEMSASDGLVAGLSPLDGAIKKVDDTVGLMQYLYDMSLISSEDLRMTKEYGKYTLEWYRSNYSK